MKALTAISLLFFLSSSSAWAEFSLAAALPERFDWRDVGGRSYVAEAGDQGDCGSCVAFAMMTALESQLNVLRNTPYAPWEFSRQFVFSCGGGECRKGWRLSQAVEYLAQEGAPDRACMPYSSFDGQDTPCQLGCSDAQERSFHIQGYKSPTTGLIDVEAIKQALLKGPVLSSLILYSDFEDYRSGIYSPSKAARVIGSHAFVIIGWDDRHHAWIGRNSMGKDWGMDGDFYVSWNDRSLPGRYTYHFDIEQNQPFVAFENLRNNSEWSDRLDIRLHSQSQELSRVDVFAVQDPMQLFDLDRSHLVMEVDTLDELYADSGRESAVQSDGFEWHVQGQVEQGRLRPGDHYLYGVAYHDGGITLSQPVRVRIR